MVEKAKLILSIGGLKSDFNTGMFTYRIPTTNTIEVSLFEIEPSHILNHFQLHSDHTLVRHARFPGIGMKLLLPKLTSRLSARKRQAAELVVPRPKLEIPVEHTNEITHAHFWPRVGKFFRKKDVIVGETGTQLACILLVIQPYPVTGTSNFGLLDVPFPEESIFVSQILYGSIGWTVGKWLNIQHAISQVI